MRKRRVFAAILAACMCLTACAPKNEPGTSPAPKDVSTAAATGTANAGTESKDSTAKEHTGQGITSGGQSSSGEKTVTIGTPYTIDTFVPWNFTSDGDRYVISNVYECLFEYDADTCIPVLAESYTNPDDCTWDIKLREDACWQTGNDLFGEEKVPLKAEDVKFVMDWTLDPANSSKQQTNLASVVSSVEVLDDYTLRFTTPEPKALFLFTLSRVMIFPKKAVEEGFDLNAHPVGSGPYKFVSYMTDDQVILEKNPDYYITPNLDKVIFKIIPDKSVAAIALQNGEIDITAQVLSTDIDAVAAQSDLMLVPNTLGWYRYAGFNCKDPLFTDPEIRKALSMAVDMDSAVQAIFRNDSGTKLAVRAYGPIPLELPGADEEEWKKYSVSYDPDGAKKILEDKGWKLGGDGIYEKDGKKFSFSIKTPNNDNNRVKLGTIISTQLKQIGIDCVAQPTEWATMLTDIKAGDTQMFVMGGGSSMNGMEMLFHTTLSQSNSHRVFYDNPECDALIEEAAVTIDQEKRGKLLTEASCMTIRDSVHMFGYFEYVQIGVNKRVTDFDKAPTLWYALCNGFRNVGVSD